MTLSKSISVTVIYSGGIAKTAPIRKITFIAVAGARLEVKIAAGTQGEVKAGSFPLSGVKLQAYLVFVTFPIRSVSATEIIVLTIKNKRDFVVNPR